MRKISFKNLKEDFYDKYAYVGASIGYIVMYIVIVAFAFCIFYTSSLTASVIAQCILLPSVFITYKHAGRFEQYGMNKSLFYLLFTALMCVSLYISFFVQEAASFKDGVDALNHPLFLFNSLLLAPVFEELLMRGCLFGSMHSKGVSLPLAMILTSLVFALLHGWSIFFIASFSFSLAMCLLYKYHERIYVNILVHMLYNFAICFVFFILAA